MHDILQMNCRDTVRVVLSCVDPDDVEMRKLKRRLYHVKVSFPVQILAQKVSTSMLNLSGIK